MASTDRVNWEAQKQPLFVAKYGNSTSLNPNIEIAGNGGSRQVRSTQQVSTVRMVSQRRQTPGAAGPGGNKFKLFVKTYFDPKFSSVRDLYSVMFLLDVCCLISIVCTYSSFTSRGSGKLEDDLMANSIPWDFVLLLFILCLLLVLDRGLYLCKAVSAKMIFDVFIFLVLHFVVFLYPFIGGRFSESFNWKLLPLYFLKCIYFVVSAIQLHNGYPAQSMEDFKKLSYGMFSMAMSKLLLIVPFLFELRTAVDWTWTTTSLSFVDFYTLESFYSILYGLKCKRIWQSNYPDEIGKKQKAWIKFGCGVPLTLIILTIMFCPLLLFSILNSIGDAEQVESVKLTVAIEGFPPLYEMHAEGTGNLETLRFVEGSKASQLLKKFKNSTMWGEDGKDGLDEMLKDRNQLSDKRRAEVFINDYRNQGAVESEYAWQLSSKEREVLLRTLSNTTMEDLTLKVKLEFLLNRKHASKKEPTFRSSIYLTTLKQEKREQLYKLLTNNISDVTIGQMIPMYVLIPNSGSVIDASALLKTTNYAESSDIKQTYNGMKLSVAKDLENALSYWTAQMVINDGLVRRKLHFDPILGEGGELTYLEVVAFVDKTFPFFIPASFVGGGIIAMYLVLVVSFGQVVRRVISNTPLDVMITEMDNPDQLLYICQSIYVAREVKDFQREQDLYIRLISIFRCNAMLVEMTQEEEELLETAKEV